MMQAISPLDPRILRHGRTLERRPMPRFWAASGVEPETCARSLTFVLRADYSTREPWVRVEVDGATVLRQPLERGRNRVTVWRDMPAGSWHRVQLFKETQPIARDPRSGVRSVSETRPRADVSIAPYKSGEAAGQHPVAAAKLSKKQKTDKIVPVSTSGKNRHRREATLRAASYGLSYQFCCICHGQYRSVHCRKVERQAAP